MMVAIVFFSGFAAGILASVAVLIALLLRTGALKVTVVTPPLDEKK